MRGCMKKITTLLIGRDLAQPMLENGFSGVYNSIRAQWIALKFLKWSFHCQWGNYTIIITPVTLYCRIWVKTTRNKPQQNNTKTKIYNDVIKWKHFPRYWPFVRGINRSPVNSPHKGKWRGALVFSLICGWINRWVNNREAGDLRRHRAHYDVIVMY